MHTRWASSWVVAAAASLLATSAVVAIGQAPPAPTQGPGAPPAQGGGGGRGQTPTRDATTQPAVGTGVVSGFVLTEGTGTPVRRARVSLSGGAELRGGRSAISDDQGRFSFTSLPAGRFTLSASKAGYVDIAYGAKRAGRPGTPIQLADGQRLEKTVLSLPRGSVVTGVVVDEHGEPSPGTQVRVMRYVMRTGEKTLVQAGTDTTDDRGIYRIYALQPGDYMVSAAPRNLSIGSLRQTLASEVEMLMSQMQALGGRGGPGGAGVAGSQGGGGGRGGRGLDPGATANLAGGRGGQQLLDRVGQLQQQLAQVEQEQAVAYAPVYFPGTTSPSSAQTVTLGIGEERNGIDFQLQLVATATVEGTITSFDGTLPQGAQIALVPSDRGGMPGIPGVGSSSTRVNADGRFTFQNVTPGQYTLQARATIRQVDQATQGDAAGRGGARGAGPGGRGGPGAISQVLWASQEIGVSGQPLTGVALTLQPGMTVTGRVDFRGTSLPAPTDLSRVRVTLSPRGAQTFEAGAVPPAQVDATGQFTITGVAPGRYMISASAPAGGGGGGRGGAGAGGAAAGRGGGGAVAPGQVTGQWTLHSAVVGGRDAMDFPVDIAPNQSISGALLTFTDRTQELSGTIQDSSGRPTSDFTIIVFPVDNRYWLPQARRISSARPGTDGRFTLRGLPAGEYRLAAVTDVEPGEWYDPALLNQLVPVSMTVSIAEGENKVQDIKQAGGH